MTPYETHTVGNLTINLFQDPDPDNPREAFDNLGHMVCFHPRYTLGDKHWFDSPEEFFNDLVYEALTPDERNRRDRIQDLIDQHSVTQYWDDELREYYYKPARHHATRYSWLEEQIDALKEHALSRYVILPLYLYDHSGIAMSTSTFSCYWDSGQVGWIYMTLDEARANWPNLDLIDLKGRAERYLEGEVREYDMYLTGDCWGYTIVDEVDELSSCWGFYGLEVARSEAMSEAKALAQSLPMQHELSL